jgi:hypothetical protein
MSPGHRITLSLAALAIAALAAVQRDTFLRRWIVPPPPGAIASSEDLDRRIPAIRHINGSIESAIAEVAKVSGLAIAVDAPVAEAYRGQYVSLDLRDVTLDETLLALPASEAQPLHKLMLVRRRGSLVLRLADDATAAVSVRVHNIDDLLPTTPPPPKVVSGWVCFPAPPSTLPPLEQARLDTAEGICDAVQEYLLDTTLRDPNRIGPANQETSCTWANQRLIVVAPEVDQARAAEFLQALREPRR